MLKNNSIEVFKQRFFYQNPEYSNQTFYEVFHFDLTKNIANKLLRLVLEEKKLATASSLFAYQKEHTDIPMPGDLSIVTDYDGVPYAVIKTIRITIIPFKEMTFDICRREGEDLCLESWVESHARFFKDEGAIIGYQFDRDMPVVFEDFIVLYKEDYHEET